MVSAAQGESPATASPGNAAMKGTTSRVFAAISAIALMLLAANRFLSYLWWSACYSAWSGIPKMAGQWRAAGARASFNEWTFILLEVASLALLCTAMRLRIELRLLVSLTIAVVGTALFALALSWFKQGIH